MGKRFDGWVVEFESWGMTHDEAVVFARQNSRAKVALAIDDLATALADAFAPITRLLDRIARWLRR